MFRSADSSILFGEASRIAGRYVSAGGADSVALSRASRGSVAQWEREPQLPISRGQSFRFDHCHVSTLCELNPNSNVGPHRT